MNPPKWLWYFLRCILVSLPEIVNKNLSGILHNHFAVKSNKIIHNFLSKSFSFHKESFDRVKIASEPDAEAGMGEMGTGGAGTAAEILSIIR